MFAIACQIVNSQTRTVFWQLDISRYAKQRNILQHFARWNVSQFPSILTVYLTFFNFSLTLIVILRQGVFSADFESPNNTRVEVWWFRWWWVNVVNLNDTNYTLCLFEFSSLMRERSEKNYQRLSLNVIALKQRQCTFETGKYQSPVLIKTIFRLMMATT